MIVDALAPCVTRSSVLMTLKMKYTCVCVCIYRFIYIYVYMYIYICVHMYVYLHIYFPIVHRNGLQSPTFIVWVEIVNIYFLPSYLCILEVNHKIIIKKGNIDLKNIMMSVFDCIPCILWTIKKKKKKNSSDYGVSPRRRQAIIRTNAGILLIRPLETNFSEFLVKILIFSFKKMCLKVSSAKRRPFFLGLNELIV